MIKTTLFNAEAVAAGTGSILTPVELLLSADTKKFALEISIVTTRTSMQASRKTFALCWATTPENLNPAADDIPVILMECSHRASVNLSELQNKQKIQILERCLAGEYLYVWIETPQSADAYAITVVATQYAYSSTGVATATTEDSGFAYYRNEALSNTKLAVKVGAGNLFSVNLINVNATPVYVKFYDALIASVTVGTTIPILTLAIPAGDGTTPGIVVGELVKYFATGLVIAAVTELADSGTTAPATAIHVNLGYK